MTQRGARRHQRPVRKEPPPGAALDCEILRIGEQGDGIAETPLGRLYIPLTVPGDHVRARPLKRRGDGYAAELLTMARPGPGRTEPPCPHFGVCGGCALQHLADEHYVAWKTSRLTLALGRVGLGHCPIAPLARTPAGDRRRAALAALRPGGKPDVRLGFKMRDSHTVVDLAVCPVLDAAIVNLLPPLRRLLRDLLPLGGGAAVTVTRLDGGLDVLLQCDRALDADRRERLARFAAETDLARLSWQRTGDEMSEPLALRRPALAVFGGISVAVPPGAFLQASAAGEAALVAAVAEAVAEAASVADLFAGSGTFALPLASGGARVRAVDADAGAVAALALTARTAPTISAHLTCEQRDLFTRPLAAAELNRFAAVVIDPPRAGAPAQVKALAASSVPLIVYVSCNPASFARDTRILVDAGLRLEKATPVDQFLWSPHLEVVGVFRRVK